ncbi:MAG: thioredoxin family protein [Trichloromonadaceae bacterium]
MRIEVLGDGCRNCQMLEANVRAAVAESGLTAELQVSADPALLAGYGLLRLPGLAIDGRLVASGKVLTVAQVVALLPA